MSYPLLMENIDEAYALLGLTTDVRARLVHLATMAQGTSVERSRIVVETVVVDNGDRKVIEREEHGA
jgi:hypothetical protein